jgi:hypothetical protein
MCFACMALANCYGYIALATHVPEPASPIESTSMERVRRILKPWHRIGAEVKGLLRGSRY